MKSFHLKLLSVFVFSLSLTLGGFNLSQAQTQKQNQTQVQSQNSSNLSQKQTLSRSISSVPSANSKYSDESFNSKYSIHTSLDQTPSKDFYANPDNIQKFRQKINKKLEEVDRKIDLLDEKAWSTQGAASKNLKYKINHIKNIRANLSSNLERLSGHSKRSIASEFSDSSSTYERLRASVTYQLQQLLDEVQKALK